MKYNVQPVDIFYVDFLAENVNFPINWVWTHQSECMYFMDRLYNIYLTDQDII